jgi:hypothetical protein
MGVANEKRRQPAMMSASDLIFNMAKVPGG